MTTRRRFIASGAAAGASLLSPLASGQAGKRVPRVAYVSSFRAEDGVGPEPADAELRAFLRGLRQQGLVDGRNVVVLRRTSGGVVDTIPAIMKELVAQDVDVIVTSGGPAVWAAHRATDRIAIVGIIDDVLDTGLLDSLARPGHNLTGVGESDPGLHGKRLQLLKEAAPSISRLASICYRQGPNDRGAWRRALDAAGRELKVEVTWVDVDAPDEFDAAFQTILARRADAMYATPTHVNSAHAARLARFALDHRMPSMGFPEAGMLLGYWCDDDESLTRAAAQVRKILGGARPGDLPFEQPSKFALVLNRKTARALGLAIPRSLATIATEIID